MPVNSTAWTEETVRCDCGSNDTEYVKDLDHDVGTCEVFRCLTCGANIHVEMPD